MRFPNIILALAGAAVIGYMIWLIPHMQGKPREKAAIETYDQLLDKVRAGAVKSITLVSNQRATVVLEENGKELEATVNVPPDPALADHLLALAARASKPYQFTMDLKHKSRWETAIGTLGTIALPIIILIVVWFFMMRQMQSSSGQALTFGRSRHKTLTDSFAKVTFADVAGMSEVKQELEEVVEFLKDPEKFRALGAKIPRGVLLVGPPGCGKTLLARAIAGEAGVEFFYISGSDFVEMFVGVGASRVRDLFEQAKHHLPAIVFIDEIDAVGRQRGAGWGGGHDEREQTLNALLVEMDGFDPNADVILLAATNRPDILDPALLRPGRFDRRIIVDNPDIKEREAILRYYIREKPMAPDVDIQVLARRTPGFTGADIENMCNEAALIAARFDKKQIDMSDFDEAIDRVLAGPERKSRVISEEEKKTLAYHESGHALVANMLPDCDPAYKVSIIARGMALGYTIRLPSEDRHLMSRKQILATISQVLGGRVAEELVFGEITTGAADDLEKVTELARRMVCEFGMSEDLGPMTFGRKHGPIFLARDALEERNYSEHVSMKIDEEVRRIVDQCYQKAREILTEHRDKLDRLVAVLLEREVLDKEEVAIVLRGEELPPMRPAAVVGGVPAAKGPKDGTAPDEDGGLRLKPAPSPT